MKEFEQINKTVYGNLEQILRNLDDRLDLKLYALVLDEKRNCIKTLRVKSVLSGEGGRNTKVIQEEFKEPDEVFKKLGLPLKNLNTDISQVELEVIQSSEISQNSSVPDEAALENRVDLGKNYVSPIKQDFYEWNILYTNSFIIKQDKEISQMKYILSIEYVDANTRNIFLERPQMSFIRMVLDYYFLDYYTVFRDNDLLFLNEDTELESKYKENSAQFLQRMARLFFGKIQEFIICEQSLSNVSGHYIDLSERVRNQNYINNLLEKIDGISTRTYEGESPFGCMLIINENLLANSDLIHFSIKFQNHQPIQLEDARRIRKLLELTNNESDLYLIADDKGIYGVGTINWSELANNLVFKVEFKGLSKYDLLLITTEEKPSTDARVVAEDESRIFKMTTNLEIVPQKLIGISFKNPVIASGGFTSELFKRTMRGQFKNAESITVTDEQIEKLGLVIKKATEQQSGTMVVITDPETAEAELKKLQKQSTPIFPTEISPTFIKHLTSIDGAIYFDTTGSCHAIGVILDGLAHESLGDASRGARFHSAYRYLKKLKDRNKPCVIAIISEDGMVNLIPERVNEAVIRQLVGDMITHIKDDNEDSEEKLQDCEKQLQQFAKETEIDPQHYFKLAFTFYVKSRYLQAAEFYEKGYEVNSKYTSDYLLLVLSYLNYARSIQDEDEKKHEYYMKTLKGIEHVFQHGAESEITIGLYTIRGISLYEVGIGTKGATKKDYFNRALADFTKSIEMQKIDSLFRNHILYQNRGDLYKSMGNWKAAIDDYIDSELIKSQQYTIDLIAELIKEGIPLFFHAQDSYFEKRSEHRDSEALKKLLEEHGAKLDPSHPLVAAGLEKQQPEDEE
ncbi:diadenylate cyclase [Paenibacillus sp. 481]|uniref:diadenylate cyclase n=1 Tax=Paenibacillus sp. 481 TaxID=2835869 RepID=UPI001E48A612|nr:diadenylate cyclase [Paenibacillus sp. 481]UHA74668.1 diadenylate cyclase [Paenibacillus sp. 481]